MLQVLFLTLVIMFFWLSKMVSVEMKNEGIERWRKKTEKIQRNKILNNILQFRERYNI